MSETTSIIPAVYTADESTLTLSSKQFSVKDTGITVGKMAANSVGVSQLVGIAGIEQVLHSSGTTACSQAITCSSTDNKIFILVTTCSAAATALDLKLDGGSIRNYVNASDRSNAIVFVDTPADTSAHTYTATSGEALSLTDIVLIEYSPTT